MKTYFSAPILFFLILSFQVIKAQPQLWGVASSGSTDNLGTIYKTDTAGENYSQVYPFTFHPEGEKIYSWLINGSDGWNYGMASLGGSNDAGTIFRYQSEGEFEKLFDFEESSTGGTPTGGLVETEPGIFYGLTSQGGLNSAGTLFRYSTTDGFELLYNFNNNEDGGEPLGSLTETPEGLLIGLTSYGGENGAGTVFQFDPENGIEILHHFDPEDDGGFPQSSLTHLTGDEFIGTCSSGGEYDHGTIFKITTAGDFSKLYDLNNNDTDGKLPKGSLTAASNGDYYGICTEGGTNNSGTIFKISPQGTFTKIHDFVQFSHGGLPIGSLTGAGEGTLFGMTRYGGQNSGGTIFKISLTGEFTKLIDLSSVNTGINPMGRLLLDEDGWLHGGTYSGGLNQAGTLFSISTEGDFSKIRDLSSPLSGNQPNGGLTFYNNFFYGTTQIGGEHNHGTIFRINQSLEFEVLHHFNGPQEGRNPQCELIFDENGVLYGTTPNGGEFNVGTIFSLTPDLDYQVLHHFSSTEDGSNPFAGLTRGLDNNFYGLAYSGGEFNRGTFYSITSEGAFTKIRDLNPSEDGGRPYGRLLLDEEGNLWGTCREGGASNAGVIFNTDTEGNWNVIHEFSSSTDGRYPQAGLTLISGSFYGVTMQGGENNGGTLFKISEEEFTVLHHFSSLTGSSPQGEVLEIAGTLFGTCGSGGENNGGTIYRFDLSSGVHDVIHHFDQNSGRTPLSTLVAFFPECAEDTECNDGNECTIDICDAGICNYLPINPQFTTGEQNPCDNMIYSQEIILTLTNNPGGEIIINDQVFVLSEGENSFLLENLEANGLPVTMQYTFSETGCQGVLMDFFTAPEPCYLTEVAFTVNMGSTDILPGGAFISGSFNGWNPQPMTETEAGIFTTTLTLSPGIYEYHFINGDNGTGESVSDECGVEGNRILEIAEEDEFISVEFCFNECYVECTSGLEENFSSTLKVFPVPSKDFVQIEYSGKTDASYSIVDMKGSPILKGRLTNKINLQPLNPGLYFIIIQDGTVETRAKIVKE